MKILETILYVVCISAINLIADFDCFYHPYKREPFFLDPMDGIFQNLIFITLIFFVGGIIASFFNAFGSKIIKLSISVSIIVSLSIFACRVIDQAIYGGDFLEAWFILLGVPVNYWWGKRISRKW